MHFNRRSRSTCVQSNPVRLLSKRFLRRSLPPRKASSPLYRSSREKVGQAIWANEAPVIRIRARLPPSSFFARPLKAWPDLVQIAPSPIGKSHGRTCPLKRPADGEKGHLWNNANSKPKTQNSRLKTLSNGRLGPSVPQSSPGRSGRRLGATCGQFGTAAYLFRWRRRI